MELFKNFPTYYCTEYLMLFTCLFCFVIGIAKKNKFSELRRLHFYPLSSCIQIASHNIIYKLNFDIPFEDKINLVLIHFFTVVEIIVIYNFYSQIFKSKKIRKIMWFLPAGLLTLIITYWLLPSKLFIPAFDIFFGEAVCILIPEFYYFIELFKYPLVDHLKNEPVFWVITGIIFYFSTTLPLFSFKDLIQGIGSMNEPEVYSINFICYSILFLMITKAYLCRPREILS